MAEHITQIRSIAEPGSSQIIELGIFVANRNQLEDQTRLIRVQLAKLWNIFLGELIYN